MASPAASLGLPNDHSDFDLFGSLSNSTAQPAKNHAAAAASAPATQQYSGAVDPFDLFGEGSTVPASAAAASAAPKASIVADDSLFGDVDGYQGNTTAIARPAAAPFAFCIVHCDNSLFWHVDDYQDEPLHKSMQDKHACSIGGLSARYDDLWTQAAMQCFAGPFKP